MTESTDRPTWITDRQPLPVDSSEDGSVEAQLAPGCETSVYMHYAYVAQGTPWRHLPGWTFPEIRLGQIWRCQDGQLRTVKRSVLSDRWFIGEYFYDSVGEAPGGPSYRLAELISQPKQEPEPEPEPEPQPRRRFASLNGYVSNGEEILIAIDTDGVAWTSTAGFQWVRVVDLPND